MKSSALGSKFLCLLHGDQFVKDVMLFLLLICCDMSSLFSGNVINVFNFVLRLSSSLKKLKKCVYKKSPYVVSSPVH